jgi:hypothetical protein
LIKGPKRPVPFELLRLYKTAIGASASAFSSINSFARLNQHPKGFLLLVKK